MTHSSPPRAVAVRFNLDIELYAFAMFAASGGNHESAESYMAALLTYAMNAATGTTMRPAHRAVPSGGDGGDDGTEDIRTDDRGMVPVRLPVAWLHYEHADRYYSLGGFCSAEDCLQGVLNAALMEAMAAYDDQAPAGTDWRPLWLREYLASLGGAWDGDEPPRDSDDFDADLPF